MKNPKPGENKEDSSWEYRGKFNYHVGCKTRQHDDRVIYDLPYQRGQRYKVTQSDHGIKSHFDELVYAYDWQIPEGSRVHAARSGTVVDAFDRLAEGKEKDPSSYVYISHSDGTIGQYRGLKYKGCFVKKGQKINKGDLLGLSGSEGLLHFHVSTPTPGETFAFKTFPLRFQTQEGVTELEHGRWYQK
jgi:murein DD-endopeptidase MepM/ murein hydrolase activator NlpD